MTEPAADGIRGLLPREQTDPAALKLRDIYNVTPDAPFYHRTFGLWMCMDQWLAQGLPQDVPVEELFMFDRDGKVHLGRLGWCTAAFCPAFDQAILEDRGDHELIRDEAGRHVLMFKGRRSGFMPEYVDHPVKDRATWERDVKWRLDPATPQRWSDFDTHMAGAVERARRGLFVSANMIGGYMFLRSLMGPEDILYKVYDDPGLVHDCMQTWLALADAVTARMQAHVSFDEIYLAEDICYNHGPLIGPDMMREFLFPYYRQLIANVRSRQLDRTRKLHVTIDTDGLLDPVIPVYGEIGMTTVNPFEVASGCDVVRTGAQYPDLVMWGGIDKRVLAKTPDDIDRELDRILPAMRRRGGYFPTCDHGVPPEVPWQNYLHYRQRCIEIGGPAVR